MPESVARLLSIVGHPLVTLPLAVLLVMAQHGDAGAAVPVALGFAGGGAALMAYSWQQVRRGRWSHVDASHRTERTGLNRVLVIALGAAAVATWQTGSPRALAIGLGLGAAIVVAGMLAARWCKLSLHVAFAVHAAGLVLAIGAWATAIGAGFAALVAWSRLVLERHVPRDLVAGALAGAAASAAYWALLRGG